MAPKSKKPVVVASMSEEAPARDPLPPLFPTLSFESLADLSRDNLAAVAKANQVFAEGMQAIGDEIMTYAKSTLETAGQTATALLGARTLDEVIQLNSDLAKTSMETLLARSAKISEMGVTLASETLAPIGDQVEATLAKLKQPLAA